jgi:hypothetical protein
VLVKLLTPEPKEKKEAPVGAETKASASPSHTCTRRQHLERRAGANLNDHGVGDGKRGSMASTSSADALEVPPNSKTEVGDRPTVGSCSAAPSPSSPRGGGVPWPYSCRGQTT